MTDERFDSFLRGLQRAEQFRNNQKRAKMIQGKNWKVFQGNNLDVLPTLEDNSIDAIVTDPPYELGFMGKKWDSSGIAYNVELWRECLRVLKPGGHILAFSGSRTYHRMVVAIEDAGFEIRDMISWISDKTFPKSLDISKAIDKSDAAEARRKRDLEFTAWIRSTGLTATQIDKITNSNMGGHYTTAASQPAVATAELFDKLRPYLPEVPDYIEKMVAERTIESQNYKKREVIGQKKVPEGHAFASEKFGKSSDSKEINETAPATLEAQQWKGWGTALKPTVEPIVMARKPLIGTVAENVLTYGTGGLNIDGSRVEAVDQEKLEKYWDRTQSISAEEGRNAMSGGLKAIDLSDRKPQGRWPANVILDETAEEMLGSPARFFYVARASKRDRNEGLEHLEYKRWESHRLSGSLMEDGITDKMGRGPWAGVSKNHHPTVKPTTLMEYLIKLVTPPGGTVLDPFAGSGSTGKAAILEGFDFIGIELTEEYLPIIEGRLKWAEEQRNLAEAKKDEALF